MKVKVEMEFDVNEVTVAYKNGVEIDEVEDVIRDIAYDRAASLLGEMGYLRR